MKTESLILATLMLLLFFTCKNCGEEDCVALADMDGEIVADSSSALAGTDYGFDHQIDNIEDALCDATETAGFSDTHVTVEYAPDQNMPFSTEFDTLFDVEPIPPGENITEKYNILFEEPGVYRINTFADGTFRVEERNEDNNDSQLGAEGRSFDSHGEVTHSLQVTVSANPSYKPQKDGPKVSVSRVSVLKSF